MIDTTYTISQEELDALAAGYTITLSVKYQYVIRLELAKLPLGGLPLEGKDIVEDNADLILKEEKT